MRGIIKALILGWIGKKIYDRVTDDGEPEKESAGKPARPAAHAKSASPKRTTRKTTRRAA